MPRFLRQFGLRTLLLFCTLAAVCFGLWRWHMTWIDLQYQLAEQIAEKRGDVSWSTWGPAWLHQTFGSRYFSEIVTVHWEHDNVSDDDIELLGEISTLEEVYIAGNPITDRGIKVLERLPRVRKLSLWSTRVSDDGLASVGKLRNLEVLDIKHSQFTNKGLVHLREMTRLRRLLLSMWLNDEGIEHLATIPRLSFKSLKTLGLTDATVSLIHERIDVKELRIERPYGDRWAEFLVDHPTLESLYVVHAEMSDTQLRELMLSNRLQYLSISNTPVSDEGLIAAKQLTNMKSLHLAVTKVTPAGIFKIYGSQAREVSIYSNNVHDRTSVYFNRPIVGPSVEWIGKLDSQDLTLVEHVPNMEKFYIQSPTGARGVFAEAKVVNEEMDGGPELQLDDASLSRLAQLPALSDLQILGVQDFSAKGLTALANAKQLRALTITSAGLTDKDIAPIGALTELQRLNLSGNGFSSKGMQHLTSLTKLENLELSVCLRLDSEAGKSIREMTSLKAITAKLTPLGDEGLRHLHGMPALVTVDFRGPGITTKGIRDLRNSLPVVNNPVTAK